MGSEARARLGLAGLLAATLLSFGLVFGRGSYRGVAFLGVVFAWALALVARRMGAGSVLTVLISLAGLFWYVVAIFQTDRTFLGIPTGAAVRGLGRSLGAALEKSAVDYAPVPVRPGYVIAIVAGLWVATALGEVATFRWRRPLLASLLPLALVTLALIVGTGENAWLIVALFVAALVTYWGLESAHRLRSWGRWIPVFEDEPESAPPSVAGDIARRMAVSCVAAALVAPAFLPALERGLLSWRRGAGGSGGAVAATIDPLVTIVPELLRQTDRELMRVTADEPAYWRLVTLTEFDGTSWTPAANAMAPAPGGFVPQLREPLPAPARLVDQTFTMTGLEGDSLPAAGRPTTITLTDGGETTDVRVDVETVDLRLEGGLSDGLTYEVQSVVPDLSFAEMKDAQTGDPGPEYLDVPGGTSAPSDEVRELLRTWTEGAETDYEQLLALQSRFRHEFAYSESERVDRSASTDYLTTFLTDTKAGYCQQFATAFALLARMNGLPSRVAVGFLPGATDIATPDTYVVRGTDAHAWPEVHFEGYGWVPFEPTPRGTASPPLHTVPRAAGVDPGRGAGRARPDGLPLGGRGNLGDDNVLLDRPLFDNPFSDTGDLTQVRRRQEQAAWEQRFARIRAGVLAALVLFLTAVPALKWLRIKRRYARARMANERAAAAYAHFEDEAAELALPRSRSESAVAHARRLAALHRVPERWAVRLASIYEAAEYGGSEIAVGDAEEAGLLAKELRGRLWRTATWWRRAARLFSPARLRRA
ncbi:MAG: DUF3488 and DUF4129 domain-containing transglutaminase family protein [Actinomycetota bacterium]